MLYYDFCIICIEYNTLLFEQIDNVNIIILLILTQRKKGKERMKERKKERKKNNNHTIYFSLQLSILPCFVFQEFILAIVQILTT